MQLPQSLLHVRAQLDAALLDHAIPAEWPEGEKFLRADQPKAIAQVLIKALRPELGPARIAHLYREAMKRGEMVTLGKASKAAGASKFLHHQDFLIVYNWTMWKVLSNEQRLALVDHELTHCDFDQEKGFVLRHHDVEDFVAIVDRWGLWTRGLQDLAKAIPPSAQAELFAPAAARTAVRHDAQRILDRIVDEAAQGTSPLRPAPGSGLDRITLETNGRSVTLHQDGRTEADGPWTPPAGETPAAVGAGLAAAAAREPLDTEEPPVRRPREPLVHRKRRPAGRGKDQS